MPEHPVGEGAASMVINNPKVILENLLGEENFTVAKFKQFCRREYHEVVAWKVDGSLFNRLKTRGWDLECGDTILWDSNKDTLYFQRWRKV